MHPGSSPVYHHRARCALLISLVAAFLLPFAVAAEMLTLPARSRVETSPGSGEWTVAEKTLHWDASKTAIVICDMWNRHWCPGATERVAEMAPRMNEVLKAARAKGVQIIHCPSDTMDYYKGTPARLMAQSTPKIETRVPLLNWCNLDTAKEANLPVDDSDGGCDGCADCTEMKAWSHEIDTLQIQPGDAVTDSAEAYYLMHEHGITNVIVMGVHANMCVLGRPFSIRQMRNQGQNVVLMRDMTDSMYDSQSAPYVNHFRGTGLIIEHIERYWCPSITSVAFLGGEPFHFRADHEPKVVFMIGEDEYHTWETLPIFAEKYVHWRGLRTEVIQQNPNDKNDFPGLTNALKNADLLVVSVRRRALSKANLDAIHAYLNKGKPLVGIRTASHAFYPKGDDAKKGESWREFDAEVLGGNYHNHRANGTETHVRLPDNGNVSPILTGVDLKQLIGHGSLYMNNPLQDSAHPMLIGSIPDQPSEPIAWTHTYGPKHAKVFYTSLGHPDDFKEPAFRRLLLNGILWALNQPIPPDDRLQPR